MDEGFQPNEVVFFKGGPYFPVGKIAELLDVDEDYIDNILGKYPGILKQAISVEEIETNQSRMFFNLIGCLDIGVKCERSKVGAHCKFWIFRVMSALMAGNFKRFNTIYKRNDVHRFVKSLLKYFVPSGEESYEFRFREPVQ